jgi:hypothetical protein
MGAAREQPESAMTPSDSGDVRIRNRRYRPWSEIVGVMWFVLFMAVAFLPFALDRRFDRLAKWALVAVMLGGTGYCLRMWLIVLDLTERPVPGRRETARAVWDWVFRGSRPKDPRRVRVTIALYLFGWVVPTRISVAWLRLGDAVAFDSRVPVPAGSVRRVRFAPDPNEDYVESDRPVRYCAAAIELNWGREFHLILDQADAGRLREWAAARGIAVCDTDGYQSHIAEPNPGVPAS